MYVGSSTSLRTTCLVSMRMQMIPSFLSIQPLSASSQHDVLRAIEACIQLESVTVGDYKIKPISSKRNLRAWFDKNLLMSIHVSKDCAKAFRGLYSIRRMCKYILEDYTKVHLYHFITSPLDYCNSLLYGIPKY